MQSVGLQTVLQMSSAAERVQQVAQSHGAVAAEQYKDVLAKENDIKATQVQETGELDEAKIRDEDQHPKQGSDQQKQAKREAKGEETIKSETDSVTELPVDASSHGRLLNIKV